MIMSKKLFEQLDTTSIDTGDFFNTTVEIWFSEKLLLYIEYNVDDNSYLLYTPLSKLSEIKQDEADMIRKQLNLCPTDAITYYHLYQAGFTNLFALQQLQKEEII